MLPYLDLGGLRLPLYGIFLVAAYMAGCLYLLANRRHLKMSDGMFWAFIYCMLFTALAGSRLGYYLVEWHRHAGFLTLLSGNWRTGWVLWGGFGFATAAAYLFFRVYSRLYRPRPLMPIADYFGPMMSLGQVIGRLACFLEGCCHGRPTDLPWGVRFTHPASGVDETLIGVPLHPVQLLEMLGNLAIFIFLHFHVLPRIRRKRYPAGAAICGYGILYGSMRFFLEFLRGDDRGDFLASWLSPGQWMSLIAVGVCGSLLYRRGLR